MSSDTLQMIGVWSMFGPILLAAFYTEPNTWQRVTASVAALILFLPWAVVCLPVVIGAVVVFVVSSLARMDSPCKDPE